MDMYEKKWTKDKENHEVMQVSNNSVEVKRGEKLEENCKSLNQDIPHASPGCRFRLTSFSLLDP